MRRSVIVFLLGCAVSAACESNSRRAGSSAPESPSESQVESPAEPSLEPSPPSVPEGGAAPACCESAQMPGCSASSVAQCVCEDWQQQQCCAGDWTAFCQLTAEEKCGALPLCDPPPPPADGDIGAGKGACCRANETAGCSDPATEQCVCALLPDCCTLKWDFVCAQIVNEQRCEAGVRECVCQEWQQADCCDQQWTDFCSITAEAKCGAAPSCS